jgi:hypothetical protein
MYVLVDCWLAWMDWNILFFNLLVPEFNVLLKSVGFYMAVHYFAFYQQQTFSFLGMMMQVG